MNHICHFLCDLKSCQIHNLLSYSDGLSIFPCTSLPILLQHKALFQCEGLVKSF